MIKYKCSLVISVIIMNVSLVIVIMMMIIVIQ